MPISPVLFNNILILQIYTETTDGQGGVTTSWAAGGSFRARISPVTSDERMSQNKTAQFTSHRIYCNNMTVTTKDRIKWGDVYFEILGITNPSEAYDHLEMDCREIFEAD